MEIIVLGLNHKTASVELRERLAFSKSKLDYAYECISNSVFIKEAFILSTCNRVELYCVVDNFKQGVYFLKRLLSRYHNIEISDFEDNLYIYSNAQAVSHLFEVACGLDSLVMGETQILRQLKEAYFSAQKNETVEKFLNVLLQKSFHTAKQVHNYTNVGKAKVSISSIAVKLAEQIFRDLSKKNILVVGAGKVSELTVKYLVSKGVDMIVVSNRNFLHAEELSKVFPDKVRAIKFDALLDYINIADIVISSTSAPHFVIRYNDINRIIRNRKDRSLLLIDLAVPRDIDPALSRLEGIYLYDIDDLEKIAKSNAQLRQEEIISCKQIIQRQVTIFMDWFDWEKIATAFKEVRDEFKTVCVY